MKKTWKQINKIIHKGKNKDNINCIKTSQGIENNPHVISNKFNSYFTTIAQNLVSKIKNAPDFQQILDQQVQESIFLNPTTKEQEALKRRLPFSESNSCPLVPSWNLPFWDDPDLNVSIYELFKSMTFLQTWCENLG